MEPLTIKVKRLRPGAYLPTKATPEAAAWDLYTPEDFRLYPGGDAWVGLGIAVECPPGCFLKLETRSGMARRGLQVLAGVVDGDFRGDVTVVLRNHGETERSFQAGDRIAQAVLLPVIPAVVVEAEELSETQRGSGGFGSTGR